MITKHVSLWYNIIYNMIKLLDNYLFYFAKICLKYTSSNMFWIVLLNKNLRTFWGWFVIKHPINKNSISLTSEIVCSYMQVFTVQWNPETPPKKVQIFEKSGGVAEITMFCWQIETRFGLHYLVVREMETFLYFETELMFLDKEYRLENLIVFFLTWMCLPVDIWCLSKTRWKQYIKRRVTCN